MSALASSGSLADLAGSALRQVASFTTFADLPLPGLTRRGSMEGLLAVSAPLRSVSARLMDSPDERISAAARFVRKRLEW